MIKRIFDLLLYTPQQARRHEVHPSITGRAQVNGHNALSWEEKFRLELWYVEHGSFWIDLKILLLTVKNIFARNDINAGANVTMPRFTGTPKEDGQ